MLGSALPDQRAEGEWIEGVAIWIAVFAVTMVGESPGRSCRHPSVNYLLRDGAAGSGPAEPPKALIPHLGLDWRLSAG